MSGRSTGWTLGLEWTAALVLGLTVVGLPTGARAGGFEVAQQTATAAGTGGAGAARADEPSAAWTNPAALADGGGFRAALGVALAFPSVHAVGPDGAWEADSDSGVSTPPHLYASYARDRWAAGLSVNVAYGGGVTWPAEWDGRFEIVQSKPQFFRIAPFFAWSFGDLRLAAGVHVDAGSLRIQRTLDFIDTEGDVRIQLDGWGVGVDAALFWTASEAIDVGLTYRSRTALDLSGGANFTVPDAFLTRASDQNAEAEWTLPDRFALGISARPAPGVRVLADVGLTLWSVNDELRIEFENDATDDAVSRNEWSDVVQLRGGVEYAPDTPWVVRGGAYYDPSPVPSHNLAPSSPDMNRLGFTAGGGWDFGEGFRADAFYELLFLLERQSTSQDAPEATYSGTAHVVGATLGWTYR